MWATSKTHATQWNLTRKILRTLHAVWKGSSLVWYLSTSKLKLLLAKAVQHCSIPGLYSGIFAIYLQHRESQQYPFLCPLGAICFNYGYQYYWHTRIFFLDEHSKYEWPSLFNFVSIGRMAEHRGCVPPSNYRRHNICFVWHHYAIYAGTSNWQWLLSFI